ncbi:MAG: transcriptional repressor [Muribaculaceae bacterium]|nr:transcriptional repressor [Muribaculaceae bacterium]
MKSNSSEVERFLVARGVKPTPNRILVAKQLMIYNHPLSLADLEIELDPMDRASIFRVLELFASKDLVHVIEDGSRSVKYEICLSVDHHHISDQHVHFYCEKCKETICIEDVKVPEVKLPEGYTLRAVNYVLKGFCPKCGKG